MARSLDLDQLTRQPDTVRDRDWEQALFHALADGRVHIEKAEPSAGPDGWPYIFVRTDIGKPEPAQRLLDWLSSRGIGLVLNAHKGVPDYVFPYGMIWNWKETGQFVSQRDNVQVGQVEFKEGEKVLAGSPTPEYLPDYVRKVLAQFLRQQGAQQPRILLISRDKKHYDLCFSIESLGSPPPHEHKGIAEALAWFLPQHYSLMLISEEGLPKFTNL